MKRNTRILMGFISVILFILIQMAMTYHLQDQLYKRTIEIKNIESPLEVMSEQVIGYDAMLTGAVHEALLNSLEGDVRGVRERRLYYDKIGVRLDDLLKRDSRILISQSKRPEDIKEKVYVILDLLDKENIELVNLETEAFDAMEKNDTETAYALTMGAEYRLYKDELYENYRAWSDIEHSVTSDVRSNILRRSQIIIYLNLGISIGIMVMIIITLLTIRSFVCGKGRPSSANGK